MKVITVLVCALVLSGCAVLPSPSATIAPGNAQVRLSQVAGHVETPLGGGEAVGASCVLTVLGKLPLGTVTVMQQGTCQAQVVGQD